MSYRIDFSPSAARDFRKFPLAVRERLRPAIDALTTDPRPRGAKAMSGWGGALRIRVGEWRIVYRVEDEHLLVFVFVVRVGHRGDVYRVR